MQDFRWELITDFNLDKEIRVRYINAVMAARGFKLLGEGRMRRTYLSPNKRFVLKFPMDASGIGGNQREHLIWHKQKRADPNGITYAPCRLINNTLLMMWTCDESFGDSKGCLQAEDRGFLKRCSLEAPKWADFIDCRQVGLLRNGKFAAYDYT